MIEIANVKVHLRTCRGNTNDYFSNYCLLIIMRFLLERFHLPLGAWDRLRYLIVALPVPSI